MVGLCYYNKTKINYNMKQEIRNKYRKQIVDACISYINDNSFVQQALLLSSHDKVMCVVLVVHNVL